eukprot:12716142-Alexandrium_andersonii.AAC.1
MGEEAASAAELAAKSAGRLHARRDEECAARDLHGLRGQCPALRGQVAGLRGQPPERRQGAHDEPV